MLPAEEGMLLANMSNNYGGLNEPCAFYYLTQDTKWLLQFVGGRGGVKVSYFSLSSTCLKNSLEL